MNSERVGVGYFLSQRRLYRNLALRCEDSNKLLQEWHRWIWDLQNCPYEHVKIAAGLAPSTCHKNLNTYYQDQVVTESEITSFENSSKKLVDSEKELISLA